MTPVPAPPTDWLEYLDKGGALAALLVVAVLAGALAWYFIKKHDSMVDRYIDLLAKSIEAQTNSTAVIQRLSDKFNA